LKIKVLAENLYGANTSMEIPFYHLSFNLSVHLLVYRCGPCQFMFPVLEQVSEKMKDKIQVVKIDTEKYTQIADRYQIAALPTFIIFKDGKPLDRFVRQRHIISRTRAFKIQP